MANNLEGYSDLLYENIVSLARSVVGDCWMGLGLDLILAIEVPYEVLKLLDLSITCLKTHMRLKCLGYFKAERRNTVVFFVVMIMHFIPFKSIFLGQKTLESLIITC